MLLNQAILCGRPDTNSIRIIKYNSQRFLHARAHNVKFFVDNRPVTRYISLSVPTDKPAADVGPGRGMWKDNATSFSRNHLSFLRDCNGQLFTRTMLINIDSSLYCIHVCTPVIFSSFIIVLSPSIQRFKAVRATDAFLATRTRFIENSRLGELIHFDIILDFFICNGIIFYSSSLDSDFLNSNFESFIKRLNNSKCWFSIYLSGIISVY